MGLEYLDDMQKALLKEAKEQAKSIGQGRVNTSKVRMYYNEILSISNKLREKAGDTNVWYKFYLLKAKSNYDFRRGVVSKEFKDFISSAVDEISEGKDVDKLYKFRLFFEAVVGFFPKNTAN